MYLIFSFKVRSGFSSFYLPINSGFSLMMGYKNSLSSMIGFIIKHIKCETISAPSLASETQ